MIPEFFVSEFNDQTLNDFRAFERDNHDALLKIVICSNGGDTDSVMGMLAIMDKARANGKQFITVGIGRALSAGLILLNAGDFRYADRRCRLMMHQVSCGASGTSSHLTIHSEEIKRLNKTVVEEMARKCKMTAAEIERAMACGDWYMSPAEALNCGVVDYVGLPYLTRAIGVLP